jgi:hypothetical protein
VEFHPAWHELMRLDRERGIGSWRPAPRARIARAAKMALVSQTEAGHAV